MKLNVVENAGGRAQVCWLGTAVLFLGLFTASAAIPAAGFWLVFRDLKMVSSAVAVGTSMACCSFPLLLIQQLRLPLNRLPAKSENR